VEEGGPLNISIERTSLRRGLLTETGVKMKGEGDDSGKKGRLGVGKTNMATFLQRTSSWLERISWTHGNDVPSGAPHRENSEGNAQARTCSYCLGAQMYVAGHDWSVGL